jgi:hypothetical protein
LSQELNGPGATSIDTPGLPPRETVAFAVADALPLKQATE